MYAKPWKLYANQGSAKYRVSEKTLKIKSDVVLEIQVRLDNKVDANSIEIYRHAGDRIGLEPMGTEL